MKYTGVYNGHGIYRPYGSFRILIIDKRRFTVAFDILNSQTENIKKGEIISIDYNSPENFKITEL